MKTRAAVAVAAGKPLKAVEVDLEGTKADEVLAKLQATDVCHTGAFTCLGFDWFMDGMINNDGLLTQPMRLDEINTAFDLMHKGESIRSVVIY